jgi:hypothetical protein
MVAQHRESAGEPVRCGLVPLGPQQDVQVVLQRIVAEEPAACVLRASGLAAIGRNELDES